MTVEKILLPDHDEEGSREDGRAEGDAEKDSHRLCDNWVRDVELIRCRGVPNDFDVEQSERRVEDDL